MQNKEIKKDYLILGIESSCDETCASVVKNGRTILSNEIISSAVEHVKFGGVVPEIASRSHTHSISIAVENAIEKAGIDKNEIDAIAVTYGSGLLGALLVGVSYAKALSYALNIPLIPVNHIRGHIASVYLENEKLEPPFITILASGGHTAIIEVSSYTDFNILGSTLDDAVGEAFDKVARILNLSYPGGPNIDLLARKGSNNIALPKMLKGEKNYNFSYSGLKTAVMNYVHNKKQKGEDYSPSDVACSFQCSAIDVLIEKALYAVKNKDIKTITVGGGVGANSYLREKLTKTCEENGLTLFLPRIGLCTDNACMIAAEGFLQIKYLKNTADLTLNAVASIPLE